MAPKRKAADDTGSILARAKVNKMEATKKDVVEVQETDPEATAIRAKASSTWNKDKGIIADYKASGIWEYYVVDGKPVRKWVDKEEAGRKELTSPMSTLSSTSAEPQFPAEFGEKGISAAYHGLWVCGKPESWVNAINNQLGDGGIAHLSPKAVYQVWQCLVRELVPREDIAKFSPIPPHRIQANTSNIWKVAKAVFYLITRGKYFDMENNVIKPEIVDGKETSFQQYRLNTLENEYGYSHTLLKLLINSLAFHRSDRPTRAVILKHCQDAMFALNSGYIPTDKRIPNGLRHEEGLIYEAFFRVLDSRIANGEGPKKIVCISDIGKDIDDTMAWIALKELKRLGLIELRGFVANLKPARQRALLGKGLLESLGEVDIPVAEGTDQDVRPTASQHKINNYEFDANFIASDDTSVPDYMILLDEVFREARDKGEKLTLLLISGLRDIYLYTEVNPGKLEDVVDRIVFQGLHFRQNGRLRADPTAANNVFDVDSAQAFHDYIFDRKIPSATYTKFATGATEIYEKFFHELEDLGHPAGNYLRRAQVAMDMAFYICACGPRAQRFQPFMDQDWYLKMKTTWYENHTATDPKPEGKAVLPYLNKILAYDVLAAIGAAGEDVLNECGISKPGDGGDDIHKLFGIPPVPSLAANKKTGQEEVKGVPAQINLDTKAMATVIRALLRGSLLAYKQGLAQVDSS